MKSVFLFFLFLFSACIGNCESSENKKSLWIRNAFLSLESGRYPKVKAISWWHENFDRSFLKVDSSSESLEAYREGIKSSLFVSTANIQSGKLLPFQNGIYHSAFPDFGGTEDVVSADKITHFESLVGKSIVWAYFSNNWYDHICFPMTAVDKIHLIGRIPFIRMMPRSDFEEGGPDPLYTMQSIIVGDFDTELEQWATEAASLDFPLLVEFGTEVNGDWFPWNGKYNGAGTKENYGDPDRYDGAERFRDAYRHIIDICRAKGANNITWFFHVNAFSEPNVDWNRIENYYPGDDYIDWLGVSVYGPQEKNDDDQEFVEIMDSVYPILTHLADKPIAVLEFAVTETE